MFEELIGELTQFRLRRIERPPTRRSGSIESAVASVLGLDRVRAQKAACLETVENGVQGSGSNAIPVLGQFLDHPQAEHRLLRRVVQHMKADECLM